MAFGVEIYNDANVIQLDQDYFNLVYQSKSTINSISASTWASTYEWDDASPFLDTNKVYFIVDVPDDEDIVVVVKPTATGRAIAPEPFLNENSSTVTAGYRRFTFQMDGTTATSITAYIYNKVDTIVVSTNSGFALVIRDSSGNVTFHSDTPALKPTHLVPLDLASLDDTYTLNSSKTYAFMFCNFSGGRYYDGVPSGTRPLKYFGLELTNSTTATMKGVNDTHTHTNGSAGTSDTEIDVSQAFIVDVTYL